ncbi:MAG TPA: site-specific integrase [Gemmataceae bacterium]
MGWIDPEGKRRCKSCGPGTQGRFNADKLRRKIESQLLTGTYEGEGKLLWKDFRKEWEDKIGAGMEIRTRWLTIDAMNHFERLVNPTRVWFITSRHVDQYVAKRRGERGRRKGSLVSEATINKELRHPRAVLRIAKDWNYLPEVPRVRMLREPGRLPTYVTGDHFAAIYAACDAARIPEDLPNISPADWWRALIVTGYMTGWRIADMLALRRDNLDLDTGMARSLAADNKGKREELVKLHPVVIDPLRKLAGFDPYIFPWNHNERTLYDEFARIQEAAGIKLPCKTRGDHEHNRHCYVYAFHDLRRAFATMNADKLTPDALQALMRHKSYQTTQKYINMARQMDKAVASLHVPDVLRRQVME